MKLKTLTGVALRLLSMAFVVVTTLFLFAYIALALPDEFDEGPFNWDGFVLTGILIAGVGFGAGFVLRKVGTVLMVERPSKLVAVGGPEPAVSHLAEGPGEWNQLAMWAFVVGIGSVFMPMAGMFGVILGAVAWNQLKQSARSGRPQRGKAMATTGILVGSVTLLVYAYLEIVALT